MSRKKKPVNNTSIPQYAIERFARCVFDNIRAAYADEDMQRKFAIWQAQQAELNTRRKKAANTAALSLFIWTFFLGPRVLDVGSMGAPLGK